MLGPVSTSRILLTCDSKAKAHRHYLPALRRGGWDGEVDVVAFGDPIPAPSAYDGLLLSGGLDIHPSNWDESEELHPSAEPDEPRDELEATLLRGAWELGLPILGICRGEQLLNVVLGGTLCQHLPDTFPVPVDLHQKGSSDEPPELRHAVQVDPASRLGALVGAGEVQVNSRHHQAVLEVAAPLRAVAWHDGTPGPDGPLIEGVEAKDPSRWVVGVQWHPENLVALDSDAGRAAIRIFEGFAAAVRARSLTRSAR
jgi:putative glutamine amidotransferase